jgi:hypothetical protein
VARHLELLERGRDREVARLGSRWSVLHEPPGASEPAAGARDLAALREPHPEPEGAPHRGGNVAVLHQGAVDRLHGGVVFGVPSRELGSDREPPQVRSVEGSGGRSP